MRADAAVAAGHPAVMAYDMTPAPPAEVISLDQRARDYARMEKALGWLADRWQDRPSLEEAAAAANLSPFHFQRLFTRWAGVSPRQFVAALAHAEARRLLQDGASVLDAALDAGLSGPSRLHDLFIAHEAVTPGEVRRRGEGMRLAWGLAATPFGQGLLALGERGLVGLGFVDGELEAALSDMTGRFPAADWRRDDDAAADMARRVFEAGEAAPVVLMGTPFQIQVWKALLRIPPGGVATYGQVAAWAGRPGANQATGAAVGANNLSLLIPCHRVIARDGRLTGYHWGLPRKAAMLAMEAARRSA